jgi:hypothetical protein
VLVNPAQRGSGVQIKTVEMLQTDTPVVCTTVGARGLSADAKAALLIADSPTLFARKVNEALSVNMVDSALRERVRGIFDQSVIECVIREVEVMRDRQRKCGTAAQGTGH